MLFTMEDVRIIYDTKMLVELQEQSSQEDTSYSNYEEKQKPKEEP
jgi:hypothetical protein